MSQRRLRRGIRPGRRPLACYHEAGHCLTRWYFGHYFDRALVLTVEEVVRGVTPQNRNGVPIEGAEGYVDSYGLGPLLDQQMLDGMGGEPEAVAHLRRATRVAVELDLINCQAGIVAEARYRKCSVVVASLQGGEWDRTRARDLLDEWFLDPAKRREAALLSERRAAALVRSEPGWAAITALAEALLDRGEVTWEEADPLCAAAYGNKQPCRGAWLDAWPPSLGMIRAGQIPAAPQVGNDTVDDLHP